MAHSNRDKRKAERKAKKASRKAAWAEKIGSSRNRKKAKQSGGKQPPTAKIPVVIKNRNGDLVTRMFHAGPKCGNRGCRRCFK